MITNIITFFAFLILCFGGVIPPANTESVTQIDTKRSVIRWKGTKMMYTRSHEGTIRFKSGELQTSEGHVIAGQFVVDMNSIEITDIPAHEPEARKNLKKHLEEDFGVSRYPTASLTIKQPTTNHSKQDCCGTLTVKGISKDICFTISRVNTKVWTTKLVLRRADFAIGEQGSWLERRLVDQEMELIVEINI